MKFGSREICNVVFKAKSRTKIGNTTFEKGQPVLYIDTAKTSTIEGAATTVYATGGRGNANLIAWEGEKTLTFTVEDALLSPIGFSILSGAGLFENSETEAVHVHMTSVVECVDKEIDLSSVLGTDTIDQDAPIFIMATETDGSIKGAPLKAESVAGNVITMESFDNGVVFVDYYITKTSNVTELQIDAENFAGYYYVEASSLFRKQENGKDMPVEITIPNVKIQSNFTFAMAASGDPSTFTFTMDAMPGYTMFDNTKKVLMVMQIVDETSDAKEGHSVMRHTKSNTEGTGTVDLDKTNPTLYSDDKTETIERDGKKYYTGIAEADSTPVEATP